MARRQRQGLVPALVALACLAVVAVVALKVVGGVRVPFLPQAQGCRVTVNGHTVDLSLEQAENASLIAAISVQRGLPARAASIALATAYQESDLENLDHGDRDSLGLFQQRPSQGWGTEAQLQDPVYATNAFYDALLEVDGFETLEITVAAQEVQRSGFPDAYADHEADARALASALTGQSPEAFACEVDGDVGDGNPTLEPNGLTGRADAVRRDLRAAFGPLPLGGFEPGGVTTGHMEGSAHYEGRAIDVFFRPVDAESRTGGWALAQYLVANASRLEIRTVIYDDRIWVAGRDDTWRDYDPPDRSGDPAVLEHRDHVHVDVFS